MIQKKILEESLKNPHLDSVEPPKLGKNWKAWKTSDMNRSIRGGKRSRRGD